MHTKIGLRRSYWYLGWACLVMFTAMQVFVVLAGFTIPADQRWLWWLILPTPWLMFQGLGIWALLAYRREKLVIEGNVIKLQGIWKTRRVELPDLRECHWRYWPRGGSTVLMTDTERLVLNWDNYDRVCVEPVIRWFRQSIPKSLQQKWDPFAYQMVIPIQRKFPEAASRMVTVNRRTWARWCLPMFVLSVVAGIWLVPIRGPQAVLIAPLPILLIWGLLHFLTPRKGFSELRLSDIADPMGGKLRWWMTLPLLSVFSILGITSIVKLYPQHELLGTISICVIGTLSLAAIFYCAYRMDVARSRHWQEQAQFLVPEWEAEWLTSEK